MIRVIPQQFVDEAWARGACKLEMAITHSHGECTGSQLKYRLARGELVLLEFDNGPWVAVQFLQFANIRVMHIEAIWASNLADWEGFSDLAKFAKDHGASAVQGACDDAVARLWKQKFGFSKAYTIMRKELD